MEEKYMRQCLQLAKKAFRSGNPPVGSILVVDHQVIGKGIESGKSSGDVTDHAEIMAIRDALAKGHQDSLPRAVIYTTHEPCIMCSYVIRHHQIPRIVYGSSVPYSGGHTSRFDVLLAEDVPTWKQLPEVVSGVLLDECEKLTEEFKALKKQT